MTNNMFKKPKKDPKPIREARREIQVAVAKLKRVQKRWARKGYGCNTTVQSLL